MCRESYWLCEGEYNYTSNARSSYASIVYVTSIIASCCRHRWRIDVHICLEILRNSGGHSRLSVQCFFSHGVTRSYCMIIWKPCFKSSIINIYSIFLLERAITLQKDVYCAREKVPLHFVYNCSPIIKILSPTNLITQPPITLQTRCYTTLWNYIHIRQELIRRWDSERELLRSASGSYRTSLK